MADRHMFTWQQILPIAVVATSISFIAGCSMPVARSAGDKFTIPVNLLVRQQNRDPTTSQNTALIVQKPQAYQQVVARLAQAQKAQLLNFPLPSEFQGKTLKDIKFKSKNKKDKAIIKQPLLKPIALTFDDGPWEKSTSQVLDILKKNKIKATFFVVGRQVQMYPQLLKQIVADGHALGNHTWSHQYHMFSQSAAAREIDKTSELIYKTTGVKISLFRPPGGFLNNGLAAYAHQKKYAVVMWSADSLDWRYRQPSTLIDRVLREASEGGIVLMHDGGGDRAQTVKALPQVIAQLRKRGYKFVTVPELMEMEDRQLLANKN
ncbi:MAG TPA: polysaccharide deacetylase family protein [Cyanobacteria bacterium UBA8553]|nr:polysaccharide deacetylase family protein [Cyanobacteria bacterium UBA8553]HAJ58042.1 polysaccharide deacetylase family protein [Cyanobacteria bacterium UBA8543]